MVKAKVEHDLTPKTLNVFHPKNMALTFEKLNNSARIMPKTLNGSFDKLLKYTNKNRYSEDRKVVTRTRYRDKRNIKKIKKVFKYRCQYCNYRLRTSTGKWSIHACHIVPHRISRDNSLQNLLVLCPKHHNEFDNGRMKKRIKIMKRIRSKFPEIEYHEISP